MRTQKNPCPPRQPPPFPGKAMDIPGIITSINPASTDGQTNPTTPSLPSATLKAVWSAGTEDKASPRENGVEQKGHHTACPGRAKSSGGRGTGTQNCLLDSSSFLHSAAPRLGAGSQFTKMVFRQIRITPVKAKGTSFQRQGRLCSKVSPLPSVKVTGNRGNTRPCQL